MRTHHVPGLALTGHEFLVPPDHDDPGGERVLDRLPGMLHGRIQCSVNIETMGAKIPIVSSAA